MRNRSPLFDQSDCSIQKSRALNIRIVCVLRKIGNRPGACGYKGGVAGQGICQYGAQIQKTKENLRS